MRRPTRRITFPSLAKSLSNLADRLGEFDQREEAVTAAGEAVELWRRMATRHSSTYLHELASSVYDNARHLSAAGHQEKALAAAGEAVNLYQWLVATDSLRLYDTKLKQTEQMLVRLRNAL